MDSVWIGILGSLLGAATGGGVAHLNAWRFAKRQEKRQLEQEQRREASERLGLAFSVVFKIQRATEILTQARKHTRAATQVASQNGWPLWQGMTPFFGADHSERIAFTSGELAMFALFNDAGYANDLQELATVHNLVVDLLREYRMRREQLGERAIANGTVDVSGKVASFESSSPDLKVLATELKHYALSLASMTEGGARHAIVMANGVCKKLRTHLKDDRFTVSLGYPET